MVQQNRQEDTAHRRSSQPPRAPSVPTNDYNLLSANVRGTMECAISELNEVWDEYVDFKLKLSHLQNLGASIILRNPSRFVTLLKSRYYGADENSRRSIFDIWTHHMHENLTNSPQLISNGQLRNIYSYDKLSAGVVAFIAACHDIAEQFSANDIHNSNAVHVLQAFVGELTAKADALSVPRSTFVCPALHAHMTVYAPLSYVVQRFFATWPEFHDDFNWFEERVGDHRSIMRIHAFHMNLPVYAYYILFRANNPAGWANVTDMFSTLGVRFNVKSLAALILRNREVSANKLHTDCHQRLLDWLQTHWPSDCTLNTQDMITLTQVSCTHLPVHTQRYQDMRTRGWINTEFSTDFNNVARRTQSCSEYVIPIQISFQRFGLLTDDGTDRVSNYEDSDDDYTDSGVNAEEDDMASTPSPDDDIDIHQVLKCVPLSRPAGFETVYEDPDLSPYFFPSKHLDNFHKSMAGQTLKGFELITPALLQLLDFIISRNLLSDTFDWDVFLQGLIAMHPDHWTIRYAVHNRALMLENQCSHIYPLLHIADFYAIAVDKSAALAQHIAEYFRNEGTMPCYTHPGVVPTQTAGDALVQWQHDLAASNSFADGILTPETIERLGTPDEDLHGEPIFWWMHKLASFACGQHQSTAGSKWIQTECVVYHQVAMRLLNLQGLPIIFSWMNESFDTQHLRDSGPGWRRVLERPIQYCQPARMRGTLLVHFCYSAYEFCHKVNVDHYDYDYDTEIKLDWLEEA